MEKNVLNTDLTGKVAVVTGAGGVLCSAFAKVLARAGAKVALLDLNEEAAGKFADEITAEGGVAKAYKCNVLDKDNCYAVADAVAADLGPCDILINGAGGNNPRATTDKEYFEVGDIDGDTKSFFDLETINKYIGDFIKREVDNYLHIHKEDVADVLENKIKESERERKAMAGVTKLARERAKKANLHNRKLRDCRIHFCDVRDNRKEESSIFITEGDSASGSITKSRDVNTQAVFSLRGKPLNCFGLSKKVVYENEEFNLLQAALDIEDGLDDLRYNKVIVATDADVDGMHIRLLVITFFLQFYPELIKKGHVYVLQTPLFRVRNRRSKIKNKQVIANADAKLLKNEKKSDFITRYCYTEQERLDAIRDLGPDPEITRFKGLGEISPDEFAHFIGPDIRLEQVTLHKNDQVQKLLEYYMGKNTMERQNFIIDNLVIDEDKPEGEEEENVDDGE